MADEREGMFERVERLERDAEALRAELRDLKRDLTGRPSPAPRPGAAREPSLRSTRLAPVQGSGPPSWSTASREAGPNPAPGGGASAGRRRAPFPDLGDLPSGEWWLGKIGIALLLFGVSFLYLLSVERGWITPPVRVGFGLALGITLVALGLRTYAERRSFAQVLLGGGVGALYVTGYAAYSLYALVPLAVAFAFMVAVTLLAFSLSIRQDGVSLALIGALGGLGTPFVLSDGSGSTGGLILYSCTILAGTAAIYFRKGWASLLAVSLAGGWSVLVAAYSNASLAAGGVDDNSRYALQLGVAAVWLLFWLAPALREALISRASWATTRPPLHAPIGRGTAYTAAVSTPLLALAFTRAIWSLEEQSLGFIALGGAAVYALAALALRRLEGQGSRLGASYTQSLVALLLLTLSLVLVLEGDSLLFALAAEAAVLHGVARRLQDGVVSTKAHLLSAVAALWVLARVLPVPVPEPDGADYANLASLTELAVIALAFVVSGAVMPAPAVRIYRYAAHVLALGWLAGELLPLPDGDTWTLLAWASYAAGLHVLRRRLPRWGLGRRAHVLCAAVALWLAGRLLGSAVAPGLPGTPIFNIRSLADLAVIALLALGGLLPGVIVPRRFAGAYRIAAHAAFLAWMWRELSMPPGGEAYVTVAWGLYAVVLLVAGLRLDPVDRAALFRGGMSTLFLVVGKLFLVDLASIDAVWRVLLFLGFGALFLALSYALRDLWRPVSDEARATTEPQKKTG